MQASFGPDTLSATPIVRKQCYVYQNRNDMALNHANPNPNQLK
jgi:hypothetical protein